ncbi:MAG: PDZ domain-containing protein, partial [Hydrogenimonas sp.]|nr:PDZ domain-containing protein [Hydrogenimonas sp.]
APGKKVKITFERNRKVESVEVKLAKFPESGMDGGKSSGGFVEGLSLQNLTEQMRRQMGIPEDIEGVMVTDVKPESAADKAGFMPGDIIIQIEDTMIKRVNDVRRAMKKYPGDKRVYINRRGMIKILVVR